MPRVWKRMLITSTTIGVIVGALLVAMGRSTTQEMAQAVALPEVEVVQVTEQDVPISSEWIGTLEGMVNATIKAKVAGQRPARTGRGEPGQGPTRCGSLHSTGEGAGHQRPGS